MRQLLEFLPLVLFFGAYQMDGDTVAVSDWSYTFDGIFSATAVLMVSTVVAWLLCSALAKKNDRRMMWMAIAVVDFRGRNADSERSTFYPVEANGVQLGAGGDLSGHNMWASAISFSDSWAVSYH